MGMYVELTRTLPCRLHDTTYAAYETLSLSRLIKLHGKYKVTFVLYLHTLHKSA